MREEEKLLAIVCTYLALIWVTFDIQPAPFFMRAVINSMMLK